MGDIIIGINALEQSVQGIVNKMSISADRVTGVLSILNGGTGNADGYIRAGMADGTVAGAQSTMEGGRTSATGDQSHAEGLDTIASGVRSHAEGWTCKAEGPSSHAEGFGTKTTAMYSHAEGLTSIAEGTYCHAEGYASIAHGSSSHSEGNQTKANGDNSHAEGSKTTADGVASHAEGVSSIAGGEHSHCEGQLGNASGPRSHVEGWGGTASGPNSHVEGSACSAGADTSHAGGQNSGAYGRASFSHGWFNQVREGAQAACAFGDRTIAAAYMQFVCGTSNVEMGKPSGSNRNSDAMMIIGGGTVDNAGTSSEVVHRASIFRVGTTGVWGAGSYNASGADYAECFEWLDGNPDQEDRVGRFVVLHSEQIQLAQPTDDPDEIQGVVSAMPSVAGDVFDDQWAGMYVNDVFGRPIYETVEYEDEFHPGKMVQDTRRKLNPEYRNGEKYIARTSRPEWDYVGMFGKLVMVDDGTAMVDRYVKCGPDGIATFSETRTRFRCMKRLDDTHIRILIR